MLALTALTVFSTQIVSASVILPQEVTQHIPVIVSTDDYLEIEVSTLPEAVQEVVKTKFEGSEISKAYVNKEGTYKLELLKEETSSVIYVNAEGELVE